MTGLIVINWNFTDAKTSFALTLQHSALTNVPNKHDAANASLSLTRAPYLTSSFRVASPERRCERTESKWHC
jgi:alkyl sulfatase BDS1-like metallo-beta-lactamase superfamily hydrolase